MTFIGKGDSESAHDLTPWWNPNTITSDMQSRDTARSGYMANRTINLNAKLYPGLFKIAVMIAPGLCSQRMLAMKGVAMLTDA